ncbi:hypothetical protein [Meridianimarinicoccus aquatilis]|uniref:hypothetical protein n=1 Tax=Meridianimarinicoccus aquatilis TaxID=2552766 RepID=UPI0014054BD9|nr:hypothetical protein [Fluviibacterium aquatile]
MTVFAGPHHASRAHQRAAHVGSIATRYEKASRTFLSMIKLASIKLWIEFHEPGA